MERPGGGPDHRWVGEGRQEVSRKKDRQAYEKTHEELMHGKEERGELEPGDDDGDGK